MRILVLSWRDLGNPRAGGAERVTYEHGRRWVAAGHHVTLFTSTYPGAPERDCVSGIDVVRCGSERTVHLAAQHWYRRLRPKPDVVVDEIHGVPFCAAAYAGVPIVAWIYEVARDIWFSMYAAPIALVGRVLEVGTLRWYAHRGIPFVACSPSTGQDLGWLGVSRDRITVVVPALDWPPATSLPAKAPDPTLLFVGRVVRMKGVEDAIRALAHLRRQFSRARLCIIGTGDPVYLGELKTLVMSLGLEAAVEFAGRVDEEEKRRRLASAHVLVHPSQREGWGINVIEANAVGTPAVAYRVPGLRDSIVDGETGLLSPRGDPKRLAASICSMLREPDDYARLQRNGLDRSSRFTWDAAVRQTLAVLEHAQASRRTENEGLRDL